MIDHLFTPIELGGISLKNRLTMAPLYLGYAGAGGTVSPLLLEHYRMMADSGVGLVVVENATVDHPTGSGSDRTIRADTDANADGLAKLAETIHAGGARACLQINHAGRFAGAASEPVAPSAVETFGRTPKALSEAEIEAIMDRFADAARRGQSGRVRYGRAPRRNRLPPGSARLPPDEPSDGPLRRRPGEPGSGPPGSPRPGPFGGGGLSGRISVSGR